MPLKSPPSSSFLKIDRIEWRKQNKEAFHMVIGTWAITILYAIIGGVSTLAMVIGIPAVIIWKGYRKVKYHIPLTC